MKASRAVRSGYTRAVAKLASGSALSQAITLAAMVVITRVYSAGDLGLLAIAVSASTILSVLATARYEFAVMNPPDEREAAIVIGAAAVLGLVFGVIIAVVAAFGREILSMIDPRLAGLAVGIAALTVAQSLFSVAQKWANRSAAYGAITSASIAVAVLSNGGPLLVPLMSIEPTYNHLIFFFGVGQMTGVLVILGTTGRTLSKALWTASAMELADVFRRHWKFPVFTLPHSLASKLSPELPVFLLTAFFGPVMAGIFSITRRAMNQPMYLLATNVGYVFHRRLVSRTDPKSLRRDIRLIVSLMAAVMIPISGVILLWGPNIFAMVFGSDFGMSGVIAQILLPALMFRMMAAPVAYVFMAFEEQWWMLILQITHVTLVATAFWIGHLANDVWVAFFLYSGGASLVYLSTIFLALKVVASNGENKENDVYAEAS